MARYGNCRATAILGAMKEDSALRVCSEVQWIKHEDGEESLAGRDPKTVTCSPRCRSHRSRRMKRAGKEASRRATQAKKRTPGQQAMYELASEQVEDAAKDVIQRELKEIVKRDVLTEDVLGAIKALVGITPLAVAAIMEDITGHPVTDIDGNIITDAEGNPLMTVDLDRRQKAYTLLMRYTVGHGALVPQEDPRPPGINVIFPGMVRPSGVPDPHPPPDPEAHDPGAEDYEIEDVDVVETLICNACEEEKPRTEFVGRSDRCTECHEKLQERARLLEQTIAEGTGS